MTPPSGILIIDKEKGYTSMDVCARVRGMLRKAGAPKRIKVGHGGTLDPMATGVLVVLVGKATPLCNVIMAGRKEYEATIDLSRRSSTDDAEGELTDVPVPRPPTREQLIAALARFLGVIQQRPPDFSAMKIGGRRAYDIARAGGEVKLTERPVTVHRFEVRSYAWPIAEVFVECGKGTYIRSLARDLGLALGTGGMLTALRRTRVGRFTIEQAARIDSLALPLTQQSLLPIPPTSEIDEPRPG